MQAENIYNRLGEDLTKWQALLVQIRKARGTFDNAETRKEFGPVVIDYGKVKIHYFGFYFFNFQIPNLALENKILFITCLLITHLMRVLSPLALVCFPTFSILFWIFLTGPV